MQKLATHIDIQYACTLEEVSAEMGISKQAAWMLQKTALKKLRRHPLVMGQLRAIAAELERNRPCADDSYLDLISRA